MGMFIPKIYQKNIHCINYKKLQEQGIKCLVFDLDNTLGLISNQECPIETKKLIEKLKKDFQIVICSNNTKKRLKPFLEELKVDGNHLSFKPSTKGLVSIRKKYNISKQQMCIIGDQILTDVLAGNRYKITTILVDQLEKKDLAITSLNRIVEKIIIKKYQKEGLFERGKYYE